MVSGNGTGMESFDGEWDIGQQGHGETPKRHPATCMKWIFKHKKGDGTVTCYKARVVTQGLSQMEGKDFFETSAPIARMSTLRTVFCLSAEHDVELEGMHVDTAYLKAPLEELFFQLPTKVSP